MTGPDPNLRVNLSKAVVLVVDGSQHSLEVTSQIVRGFGVSMVHRCDSVEEAEKIARPKPVDLVVIDPSIGEGEGYDFVWRLRHSGGPSAFAPVVLVTGHVRPSDVARGRDVGANFVVAEPISSTVLLQRILWVARDKRPFVEVGAYIGPDRRFKFEGPPPGSEGRRNGDLSSEVGAAQEPNMTQDELDAMIRPQRVSL